MTHTLGDNCIQNFHLGRYIVGYTVRNLVLRRRASGAIKCDFRRYIQRYISPNENFEYGYTHSNAFLQFRFKFEHCKPYKAAHHRMICVTSFMTSNYFRQCSRIYCRKSLVLSYQTSRYKNKCIRIYLLFAVTYKDFQICCHLRRQN